MIFIGIITDLKSENYITKIKEKNYILNKYHIIFITEKNIENIKNIRFDTIIINREFNNQYILDKLIENCKYTIINSDLEDISYFFNKNKFKIITYGFNSKSTITMSSVTEDSILVCIQRNILNDKNEIEQQEICIEKSLESDNYDIMLLVSMIILYNIEDIKKLKL